MSNSPCDAVNVVVRAPACKAPWTAPTAPASLCISTTAGTVSQIFGVFADDHVSAHSPMGDAGVMGKIAMTSFKR
jgi:hypothetical protein